MTAFGASGIATVVTTFFTGRKSGVKSRLSEKQVDVARQHLVDEVHWLREQLLMKQMKDE